MSSKTSSIVSSRAKSMSSMASSMSSIASSILSSMSHTLSSIMSSILSSSVLLPWDLKLVRLGGDTLIFLFRPGNCYSSLSYSYIFSLGNCFSTSGMEVISLLARPRCVRFDSCPSASGI